MSTETKGLGVDAFGGAVIDPTQNVRELFEAGARRQDDLRQLNDRRIDAEIRVLVVQVDGLEKRLVLRAEHAKEIRQLETERVNAIRQVDVLAGNTAAERQLVAIQTLASQTTAERETLRSLVTSTAATVATQTAQEFARIHGEIAALQKSSYEGAGKGTGTKNLWAYIFAGCGLAIAAAGFILTFLVVLAGVVVYAVRAGG